MIRRIERPKRGLMVVVQVDVARPSGPVQSDPIAIETRRKLRISTATGHHVMRCVVVLFEHLILNLHIGLGPKAPPPLAVLGPQALHFFGRGEASLPDGERLITLGIVIGHDGGDHLDRLARLKGESRRHLRHGLQGDDRFRGKEEVGGDELSGRPPDLRIASLGGFRAIALLGPKIELHPDWGVVRGQLEHDQIVRSRDPGVDGHGTASRGKSRRQHGLIDLLFNVIGSVLERLDAHVDPADQARPALLKAGARLPEVALGNPVALPLGRPVEGQADIAIASDRAIHGMKRRQPLRRTGEDRLVLGHNPPRLGNRLRGQTPSGKAEQKDRQQAETEIFLQGTRPRASPARPGQNGNRRGGMREREGQKKRKCSSAATRHPGFPGARCGRKGFHAFIKVFRERA